MVYSHRALLLLIFANCRELSRLPTPILFSIIIIILPPRQPMTPIAGNRQCHSHLSPGSRIKITERYNCGFTPAAIALGFNLIDQTVRNTIAQSAKRTKHVSLPRHGH
jgi:hypothetical protein